MTSTFCKTDLDSGPDLSSSSRESRHDSPPIRAKQEVTRVLEHGSIGSGAPNFKGLPPGRKKEKLLGDQAINGDKTPSEPSVQPEFGPGVPVLDADGGLYKGFNHRKWDCSWLIVVSSDFHFVLQELAANFTDLIGLF